MNFINLTIINLTCVAFHVLGTVFPDSHSKWYPPNLQLLGFGRVLTVEPSGVQCFEESKSFEG